MILIIDNYDSFTYNLVQYIGTLNPNLEVHRNDKITLDEIRNIRELIKFPPMNSPNKVIIIDEVHMLTTQAFNALLRTLEEPPVHGKFILATTDIQKVPMTIISRCQRFDFYRLSSKIIVEKMGIMDTTMTNILLDYTSVVSLGSLRSRKVNQRLEQRELDMELDKILRSNQVIFERPDKTVASVEYWENYFDEHPDIKPSKIVYYTGGDPTQALQQWKRDNGLSKQSEPGELKQLETETND